MLVVHLLNLLIHFMLYLSSWLHAGYLSVVSLVRISSYFASFDMIMDIIA
jgi:hypothetical protein